MSRCGLSMLIKCACGLQEAEANWDWGGASGVGPPPTDSGTTMTGLALKCSKSGTGLGTSSWAGLGTSHEYFKSKPDHPAPVRSSVRPHSGPVRSSGPVALTQVLSAAQVLSVRPHSGPVPAPVRCSVCSHSRACFHMLPPAVLSLCICFHPRYAFSCLCSSSWYAW